MSISILLMRFCLVWLIMGMILTLVWTVRHALNGCDRRVTRWRQATLFGLMVLASPFLLLLAALSAFWTWDLWKTFHECQEEDVKKKQRSKDP